MSGSAPPTRIQHVLIYFGLAEDPSDTPTQRRAHEATWTAFGPILMVMLLWDEEGHTIAIVMAALALPSILIAAGTKLRSGPVHAFCDRQFELAEALSRPIVAASLTWLIVPSSASDWIPIGVGVVVALAGLVGAWSERRSTAREPAR